LPLLCSQFEDPIFQHSDSVIAYSQNIPHVGAGLLSTSVRNMKMKWLLTLVEHPAPLWCYHQKLKIHSLSI